MTGDFLLTFSYDISEPVYYSSVSNGIPQNISNTYPAKDSTLTTALVAFDNFRNYVVVCYSDSSTAIFPMTGSQTSQVQFIPPKSWAAAPVRGYDVTVNYNTLLTTSSHYFPAMKATGYVGLLEYPVGAFDQLTYIY